MQIDIKAELNSFEELKELLPQIEALNKKYQINIQITIYQTSFLSTSDKTNSELSS
jgi:hypothetical protein